MMRVRGFTIALAAAGVLVGADVVLAPPLHKAEDVSPIVVDREGRWVHAFTTKEGRWRFAADLDSIEPQFIERLIAIEDKRFLEHRGVDLRAIVRAAVSSAKAGRIVSGASTITMQTVRLLEPRPRTLISKSIEMVRALQIERRLDKREILELYLTLAPYGGNLEGVRAASLAYFEKEPAHLTDAEQALLIALPQAPEARRPDRRYNNAVAARNSILEKLSAIGAIDARRADEAMLAAAPDRRSVRPRAAYHLARELVEERAGGEAVIASTLDLTLQTQLEALASTAAADANDGATTAIIVVNNKGREVRSLVGSSGTDVDGGWMDLTRAVRSPGSTLKPFIYGMAFDDGLLGADTLIDDMPQSFDGYSPENFDRKFRGEVRVSEALQHSLNLPAVRLLDRLGADRLATALKSSGVALFGPQRAEAGFGLTLALGGAGIAARDLAVLYSALADHGAAKPLVWTIDNDKQRGEAKARRILTAESAERITNILAGAPALEGRTPALLAEAAPQVAFKTGTSYGYRDAWAAGGAGDYTVVVWTGRADGAARPGQTGRKAAAPILMQVFDILAKHDPAGVGAKRPPTDDPGAAIARLDNARRAAPPEITFPRNGVELYSEGDGARGFALAARGGAGDYRWYVDGAPVRPDDLSGRAVWKPDGAGFYDVVVVDAAGRQARSKVRIAAGG